MLICMQPGLCNIRHCLIYGSEAAIVGRDPLHLSPFLNGISTAPTPSAVSHFNDWRNDWVCARMCMCDDACLCTCTFLPSVEDMHHLPGILKTKQHQQ